MCLSCTDTPHVITMDMCARDRERQTHTAYAAGQQRLQTHDKESSQRVGSAISDRS